MRCSATPTACSPASPRRTCPSTKCSGGSASGSSEAARCSPNPRTSRRAMDAFSATSVRAHLRAGQVVPAHPLALTSERRLDERRQRALTRYYIAAGAGGVAVGVHTTQFAIREPRIGLFTAILQLAAEEMDRADRGRAEPLLRIGGICGDTSQ